VCVRSNANVKGSKQFATEIDFRFELNDEGGGITQTLPMSWARAEGQESANREKTNTQKKAAVIMASQTGSDGS
jgi:hypothetical protein